MASMTFFVVYFLAIIFFLFSAYANEEYRKIVCSLMLITTH